MTNWEWTHRYFTGRNAKVFGNSDEGWNSLLDRFRALRDQVVVALNLTPKHNAIVIAFQRGPPHWIALDVNWVKLNTDRASNNSLEAVQYIQAYHPDGGRILVSKAIKDIINNDWVVCIQHVLRSGSMVADKLAGLTLTSHFDLVQVEIPPCEVSPLLLIDKLLS
ncbi:hypothetical protein V6N11_064760 [Hibiscus sabdariffa]|uniref:Uncharacterized protein n=1 Tax=Hibiscus sabdariffa TaxID=183260 RepID=A0ABR2SIA2_9ROSI